MFGSPEKLNVDKNQRKYFMIVRVYDIENNEYFVSEVYAIINTGYYAKYLVLQKTPNVQGYRLIEYLHKSEDEHNLEVNINVISANVLQEPWISKKENELREYNTQLNVMNKNDSFYTYSGYAFILDNEKHILNLLKGEILSETTWDRYSPDTKIKGWNYIEKETDIDNLMITFHGFHDAVLRGLNYVSGSGKAENGGMFITDDMRQVSMIFDSDWSKSIEMVFEGVVKLNLCPAKDNYSSDISIATIEKENEIIIFYTDTKEAVKDYDLTWIKSFGLRWRFI